MIAGTNYLPRSAKLGFVLTAVLLSACSPVDGQTSDEREAPKIKRTKAFSDAVGHGAAALGGRGGQVIAVTTLADSGEGSLRACVDAKGPRTCIFKVSGVIRFTGQPPIIRQPYLTIAGQTAPGGGITLAHSGAPNGRTPLVIKNTHDVVVRHIRVRNDLFGGDEGSEDSITIEKSKYVVIDHVSGSWARDEIINGYGNNDHITISNSIFAYGIPRHDKCALLGSDPDPDKPQKFSFIGNLCAHNGDRNPDINFPRDSCVEVVNNVFYNAGSEFAEVWESYGGTPVALVGNSFKAGPDTSKIAVGITRQTVGSRGVASIYMKDNQFFGNFEHVTSWAMMAGSDTPPCPLTLTAQSAAKAFDRVLGNAGAWPRDAIDRQVINDVRKGSGHIVKLPGAIPAIAAGTPYADIDEDGMDDGWEAKNGAKIGAFDAWADGDGDGVANLDAFLDHLDRTRSI